MRVWALCAVACSVAGCSGEAFACRDADACTLGGEPGLCLAGNCAYPDATCPSGHRYAVGLGNAHAGECVAPEDAPAAMSAGETTSGGSTSAASGEDVTGGDESSGGDAGESSGRGDETTSTTTGADDELASTGVPDPVDASSSGGPPTACDELGCAGCFACAIEAGGPCAMLESACESAADCTDSATCMHACAVKGLCIDDCCSGFDDADVTVAHDLHDCRAQACAAACPDLPQPYCSG